MIEAVFESHNTKDYCCWNFCQFHLPVFDVGWFYIKMPADSTKMSNSSRGVNDVDKS